MESGTFRYTFDTLRHVTNPHGIRVPSSVFLLSGGLHNESTQKVAGAPGVEADSDEELADADEEEASDSLSKLNVNEPGAGGEDDADMHKHHEGLLTYLGLKVRTRQSRETSCVSTAATCAICIQQLRSCKKAYGSKDSLQIALQ
ncbi:hypothetical protein F2Q69_00002374 [Brassica cretica]|uniref:Uncharacterized protein n=1 Tax=Brassica cretica TaxID=69181 RepID=A0A8S9NX37_BRACR|nr:hypothetical protein F2Q69_00002374 [Brassica cretica]